MNLFELSRLYEDTLALAIDSETGEILDDELVSRLDAIQEHRTEKLLNLSAWICSLEGEADAIKGQIDRLKIECNLSKTMRTQFDAILFKT